MHQDRQLASPRQRGKAHRRLVVAKRFVDFVGQHVQAVLLSKLEHVDERLPRQDLAGRILGSSTPPTVFTAGEFLLKVGDRKLAIVQDVEPVPGHCRRSRRPVLAHWS